MLELYQCSWFSAKLDPLLRLSFIPSKCEHPPLSHNLFLYLYHQSLPPFLCPQFVLWELQKLCVHNGSITCSFEKVLVKKNSMQVFHQTSSNVRVERPINK